MRHNRAKQIGSFATLEGQDAIEHTTRLKWGGRLRLPALVGLETRSGCACRHKTACSLNRRNGTISRMTFLVIARQKFGILRRYPQSAKVAVVRALGADQ